MAKVFIEETTLSAIGDAIREKEGSSNLVPVVDMASRIKAIQTGSGGSDEETENFFDAFQEGGFIKNCDYMFTGPAWNFDAMNLIKYVVQPESASYMFAYNTNAIDISSIITSKFDFKFATNLGRLFLSSAFTKIGDLDFSNASTLVVAFSGCTNLEEIGTITVSDKTPFATNTFTNCAKLKEVRFSGVLAKSGLSFADSPELSKESFESVVGVLSDTTSGLSVTFSQTAKEAAFTTDEWNALIAIKSNWTISLVSGE